MPPERAGRGAKTIAVLAVCTALVFALQVALAAIPNGECVTLLFILYTLYFRKRTLYIIYAFALLEGMVYGFGLWWFMYLYVWTILWAAVTLLGRRRPRPALFWAVTAAFFGLCYGLLCALPYFLMGGWTLAFSWWVAGIPFDLAHCSFNFAIVLTLFPPLNKLFAHLQQQDMLL